MNADGVLGLIQTARGIIIRIKILCRVNDSNAKILPLAIKNKAMIEQRQRIELRAANHTLIAVQKRRILFKHSKNGRIAGLRPKAQAGIDVVVVLEAKVG